ncbi:hypothetical protein F4825DRAFT_470538 [Nemania diffusa]|nr:hypothetical protein F4825DRAFT_470538 [Nemania diffusa]
MISVRDALFPINSYPTATYTNGTHYTNTDTNGTLYTNWLPYIGGTSCINAYIFMSTDAKAMADAYAQAQNHNEQQLLFRNNSTQETRPNASSGRPAAADVPMPPKDRDQEPKDNARSISVTISHSFEGANAKGILDQVVHRSMGVAAFRGYGSRRSVSQINVYNSPGASPMVYTDGHSFSMLRSFFTLVFYTYSMKSRKLLTESAQ